MHFLATLLTTLTAATTGVVCQDGLTARTSTGQSSA